MSLIENTNNIHFYNVGNGLTLIPFPRNHYYHQLDD